jgi:hypothetical protein
MTLFEAISIIREKKAWEMPIKRRKNRYSGTEDRPIYIGEYQMHDYCPQYGERNKRWSDVCPEFELGDLLATDWVFAPLDVVNVVDHDEGCTISREWAKKAKNRPDDFLCETIEEALNLWGKAREKYV